MKNIKLSIIIFTIQFLLIINNVGFCSENSKLEKNLTPHYKIYGDFIYKIPDEDEREIRITEYIGNQTKIEVPPTIEGKNVVGIGMKDVSGAFLNKEQKRKVEEIILPKGIKYFGNGTFKSSLIKETVLPDTLEHIGEKSFAMCSQLKDIEIPENVTSVGKDAFRECENLETATILNNTVSESMFSHCTSLETLNLSDNVTTIGRWAFNHCHSLKRVVIPDSVNSIGYKAFCASGVEKVIISSDVTKLEYGVFLNCPNLKTVIFKNQDAKFEETAGEMKHYLDDEKTPTFEGCESLTDIYAFTGTQAQEFALNNGMNFTQIAKVEVNGEEVRTDVPPIVRNNRVLMPMRAIFESLGATVEWNGETQTITAKTDAKNIVLPLNSNTMTVNNEVKTLDVGTEVIMERTLVPVRAISESIGADVKWDAERQTVVVTY